jgi:hypothetical protein
MGKVVIAIYKPREGQEQELLNLVKVHVTTLRQEGLATERKSTVMRSKEGAILEIFQWATDDAPQKVFYLGMSTNRP